MAQYKGTRYYTNKLLEMMDEGLVDPRDIVMAALSYMSEDAVEDMMRVNEMLYDEDEEEDEIEDDGFEFEIDEDNEDDEA